MRLELGRCPRRSSDTGLLIGDIWSVQGINTNSNCKVKKTRHILDHLIGSSRLYTQSISCPSSGHYILLKPTQRLAGETEVSAFIRHQIGRTNGRGTSPFIPALSKRGPGTTRRKLRKQSHCKCDGTSGITPGGSANKLVECTRSKCKIKCRRSWRREAEGKDKGNQGL